MILFEACGFGEGKGRREGSGMGWEVEGGRVGREDGWDGRSTGIQHRKREFSHIDTWQGTASRYIQIYI